jgi:hypothetical protein
LLKIFRNSNFFVQEYEAINRFVHQERLVDLWCDELKHYKLQSYKEKLEAEQPEFLRHKAEKLK